MAMVAILPSLGFSSMANFLRVFSRLVYREIIVNKVIDKQITQHLDESIAARRASAAQLGFI